MSQGIPSVVEQFLVSKGLEKGEEWQGDAEDNRPFLLVAEGDFPVFLRVEPHRLVFFVLAADFEEVSFRTAYMLMHESMRLNNFNAASLLRYSLDEDGQFLVLWNELPVYNVEFADIQRYYDYICAAYTQFKDMQGTIDEWAKNGLKKEQASTTQGNLPPSLRGQIAR